MSGVLLVEAGDRVVGLPVAAVEEVVTLAGVVPVPGLHPAFRGVTPVRDRLLPVVRLGAVLGAEAVPPTAAEAAVVLTVGRCRVALEVDGVMELLRQAPEAVPPGWRVPWAAGMVRVPATPVPVPVVDVTVLADRLRAEEVEVHT